MPVGGIAPNRLQQFMITHPGIGAQAAGVMSTLEGTRGVTQTNDVNKTISDAYMNQYAKTAGQGEKESDADYLARRYNDQLALATALATNAKPAFAVANQINR